MKMTPLSILVSCFALARDPSENPVLQLQHLLRLQVVEQRNLPAQTSLQMQLPTEVSSKTAEA